MLLAFLLLPCFLCDAFGTQYEVCYGGMFRFPYEYSPPQFKGKLYFTPMNDNNRRLIYEDGKAIDPRLKVTPLKMSLPHLTEKDNGIFSVPYNTMFHDRFTLKVSECAQEVLVYYNNKFRLDIPSEAETLEFYTSKNLDPIVLWNRTHSVGPSRGQVKRNYWELSEVRPIDSGYYNFRKKGNTLLTRKKLKIIEHIKHYVPKEDSHFIMLYPLSFTPWDIIFRPKMNEREPIKIKDSGRVTQQYSQDSPFEDRLSLDGDGLEIFSVTVDDSGIYEFRDNDGFLVFVANVDVEEVHAPAYAYVIIFAIIVAAFTICCCCIKKCCCKKSASKTSAPQTTEAAAPAPAPAVYYHGTNQPTGPSYSAAPPSGTYSYQPVNPVIPREPSPAHAPPTIEPPAYNRVDIHPDPNPTQFEPPQTGSDVAPAPSLGSYCPPSDSDPKFELKGLRFSSDLPLTNDSTFASVYTSDKLNF